MYNCRWFSHSVVNFWQRGIVTFFLGARLACHLGLSRRWTGHSKRNRHVFPTRSLGLWTVLLATRMHHHQILRSPRKWRLSVASSTICLSARCLLPDHASYPYLVGTNGDVVYLAGVTKHKQNKTKHGFDELAFSPDVYNGNIESTPIPSFLTECVRSFRHYRFFMAQPAINFIHHIEEQVVQGYRQSSKTSVSPCLHGLARLVSCICADTYCTHWCN